LFPRRRSILTKSVVLCPLALLALSLLVVSAVAQGESTKEVIAVSVADGKSSRARHEAINDDLRKAVEQGGTFVTAELTAEQQKLVEEGFSLRSVDISRTTG
jgi:replicative superfamily II helicase